MAVLQLWVLVALLLPAVALRHRHAWQGNVPPAEYESWSAADKYGWWKTYLDVGSGGTSQAANWFDDPDVTFCIKAECIHHGGKDTRKDVVPRWGCRQQGLHAEGMVAFVKAVWEDNQYTGMFQGADLGFARWGFQYTSERMINLSMAAEEYAAGTYRPEPVPGGLDECDTKDCFNVTKPNRYSELFLEEGERPDVGQFMALKFFRDGVPSAAIHTGLVTRPTANFLSRSYSNLLPLAPTEIFNSTVPGSMSEQGAQRATRWPSFTGLHDMAMYDQEGNLQHDINFPWQILFFPSKETLGKIPENVLGFWPRMLKPYQVLKPGVTLFDIYVKHSFEAPIKKIGRLELASEFMLSADTDRQVFFYHPRYERDLVLRPDLAEGYNCRDNWFCPLCPIFVDFCSPSESTLATWRGVLQTSIEHPELIHGGEVDIARLGLPKAARHLPGSASGCAAPHRALRSAKAALQRGRRPPAKEAAQPAPNEAMRGDDYALEPLTGLIHSPKWFCADQDSWPNTHSPRVPSLNYSCSSTLVPGHMKQEPEYAVDPSCLSLSLPACTKTDGTWYSITYPCLCGLSTCSTGQLCMERTSTCTSWGPYAHAGQARGWSFAALVQVLLLLQLRWLLS